MIVLKNPVILDKKETPERRRNRTFTTPLPILEIRHK
jgi:hypothetical protein